MRAPRLALLVLFVRLAFLASAAAAQAAPAVVVLATGGTISNTGQGDASRRTGAELVKALPGIEKVATVTVEQFSNVASGAITVDQWRAMAARIDGLFRERPELRGVVVTHGTDTMEETAYFLDLTVASCRPVVVTGAMRQATAVGADGPANLFNSIRVAAAPHAAGRGVMLLLNDEIFAARDVTKTNTLRLDTFAAPARGPLGVADPDSVVFYQPAPARPCGRPAVDLSAVRELPRVEIVPSFIGADSVPIDAAVAAGAKGIVIAGVGAGGMTPAQYRAVQRAARRGVVVVVSSRTGSGRVSVDFGPGSDWFGAGDLNPQKARVLLMLALARTGDRAEIARMFER